MSDCGLEDAGVANPPEINYCPVCGAEAETEPGLNRCTKSDCAFWVDF